MQGSIDGGGEHFEGYFLCNENGEVFDISTSSSQHKFLMADDSYEPDFAEYIGKSIAEAMEDENPVYEQIAGADVSTSFEIIPASLKRVKKSVIEGVIPSPAPTVKVGMGAPDSGTPFIVPCVGVDNGKILVIKGSADDKCWVLTPKINATPENLSAIYGKPISDYQFEEVAFQGEAIAVEFDGWRDLNFDSALIDDYAFDLFY